MKRIVRIFIFMLIFIYAFVFSTVSAATPKMQVVKKIASTNLKDGYGKITKEITSSNETTGEINIKVTIDNTKKSSEQEKRYENTEIFLIVPEEIVCENGNLNEYTSYIETLTKKILERNSKVKIGVIGLQGRLSDSKIVDGKRIKGEKDEGDKVGTENDSEVVISPTDNVESLISAIKNMNGEKKRYYYNLEAALKIAANSYSDNVNKILISLYDNVPKIAVGVKSEVTVSQYQTTEEVVIAKHEKIVKQTKSAMLALKDKNISFILLRPADTSFDQKWYKVDTGELVLEFDGSPYVKDLYGTLENPTYGKMYSLSNDTLETVITENIYEDIIEEVGTEITDVVVKDYFLDIIKDNATITLSSNNKDAVINEDKSITANLGNIEGNSKKTLEYTIKLNDINDPNLLDKEILTNEKIEVTYKENQQEKKVLLEDSPSVKISAEEVKPSASPKNDNGDDKGSDTKKEVDNTVSPEKLPYAGKNEVIIMIVFTAGIGIIFWTKLIKIRDVK